MSISEQVKDILTRVNNLKGSLKDSNYDEQNGHVLFENRIGIYELEQILSQKLDEENLIKQLKTFLTTRWDSIKGTAACYTARPSDEFNKICIDIADSIAQIEKIKTAQGGFYSILMPSIKQFETLEMADITELKPHQFILTDDHTLVIPLAEFIRTYAMINENYSRKNIQIMGNNQLYVVTPNELERIKNHSTDTTNCMNAIDEYADFYSGSADGSNLDRFTYELCKLNIALMEGSIKEDSKKNVAKQINQKLRDKIIPKYEEEAKIFYNNSELQISDDNAGLIAHYGIKKFKEYWLGQPEKFRNTMLAGGYTEKTNDNTSSFEELLLDVLKRIGIEEKDKDRENVSSYVCVDSIAVTLSNVIRKYKNTSTNNDDIKKLKEKAEKEITSLTELLKTEPSSLSTYGHNNEPVKFGNRSFPNDSFGLMIAVRDEDYAESLDKLLPLVSTEDFIKRIKGKNALDVAIQANNKQAIHRLLQKALTLNAVQQREFLSAVDKGKYSSVLEYFVYKMDDKDASDFINSFKAEHPKLLAAGNLVHDLYTKGDLKLLKRLNDLNVDMNAKNKDGLTIMDRAFFFEVENAVDYLLTLNHVRIDIPDNFNSTPFQQILDSGNDDWIRLALLKAVALPLDEQKTLLAKQQEEDVLTYVAAKKLELFDEVLTASLKLDAEKTKVSIKSLVQRKPGFLNELVAQGHAAQMTIADMDLDGAQFKGADKDGQSLLVQVLNKRQTKFLEWLLNHPKVDMLGTDSNGHNLLDHALKLKNNKQQLAVILKKALKLSTEEQKTLLRNIEGGKYASVLDYALDHDKQQFQTLFETLSDQEQHTFLEQLYLRDPYQYWMNVSLNSKHVLAGYPKATKILEDAKVDAPDGQGKLLLSTSIAKNEMRLFHKLLSKEGINIKLRDATGKNALDYAIEMKNTVAIEALIKDMLIASVEDQKEFLSKVTNGAYDNVLEYALAEGTPQLLFDLLVVAHDKKLDFAKTFIEKYNRNQAFSNTPLHKMASLKNVNQIQSLVDMGFKPNIQDANGDTILHKQPGIIGYNRDFDLLLKNNANKTVLDVARGGEFEKAILERAVNLSAENQDTLLGSIEGGIYHDCLTYVIAEHPEYFHDVNAARNKKDTNLDNYLVKTQFDKHLAGFVKLYNEMPADDDNALKSAEALLLNLAKAKAELYQGQGTLEERQANFSKQCKAAVDTAMPVLGHQPKWLSALKIFISAVFFVVAVPLIVFGVFSVWGDNAKKLSALDSDVTKNTKVVPPVV